VDLILLWDEVVTSLAQDAAADQGIDQPSHVRLEVR
jgi:hypothetical protein